MTTVLLTLGRLPKALDLARGFAAAGCRVLVAEPFGWTLTGASRHVDRSFRVPPPNDGPAAYLDALAAIVARESVDLVVPVSEETMHVAFLHERPRGRARLFTMPPERVLALHDKGSFVRHARAVGLRVPDTADLGTAQAQALADAGDVVVKRRLSCSGIGVRVVRAGATLPAPDPRHPSIVQRFARGDEHSSCTIAHRGRVLASVAYRATMTSGTVAVAFERVEQPAVARWIETFVAAVGWSGFIAFDFIVDEAGAATAIECNPRATSGVHFWQPEDVARAVLDPDGASVVRLRECRAMQQFYSCLTETQIAMFRGGFGGRLRKLMTTRDVTWDWRDPWPFLSMIGTSWPIIRMAMARRVPFGEVATLDIGRYQDI